MFNTLDEASLNIVIDAMDSRIFNQGETVIEQGEEGNELYLVEDGELDCFKNSELQSSPKKYLKTFMPGEVFGELALLYNALRAATIITKSPEAHLWVLDRQTFNHIVKAAST